MGLPQEKPEKIYTYADYAEWELEEGERYELLDGVPHMMAVPSIRHQSASVELVYQLRHFLKSKHCELFHAPFDVCLFGLGDQDRNVVQPDILVVCDKKKLEDGKRCNDAPELVIEILSPSTMYHDLFRKLGKYLQAGVREIWMVDPVMKKVYVHLLENNKDDSKEYSKTDIVPVTVLEGCMINLNDVFA